ncbi:Rho termination factor N-terminal domain-containing protein [Paraflavitalea speifideaquila]|uniref:Rho termination factor N-terminal domain-containing protein n=1 Tax=Paraflavitalea speifideaquila TaxID=3076558 RepID=UPI0028ECF3D6|nr:Rho termination factor N-terminal domain-containing protein [Paraflavitalea speifideiaquila]
MYDILQLNDMLVPELLDIAEQLKIPNSKKLDKQGLIYKILDKQAVLASDEKSAATEDKGKRKRIIKTTTANATEEADVMSTGEEKNKKKLRKKRLRRKQPKSSDREKGCA